MTDKEYSVISLSCGDTLDWLEGTGWTVKDGLSEEDMAAIAYKYMDALDSLSTMSDLFLDVVRAVVGVRLQEEDDDKDN